MTGDDDDDDETIGTGMAAFNKRRAGGMKGVGEAVKVSPERVRPLGSLGGKDEGGGARGWRRLPRVVKVDPEQVRVHQRAMLGGQGWSGLESAWARAAPD